MTDAIAANDTILYNVYSDKNNGTKEEPPKDVRNKSGSNISCNEVNTDSSDKINNLNTDITSNINTNQTSQTNSKNKNVVKDKCINKTNIITFTKDEPIKIKQNDDTILKYIYKKKDNQTDSKSKGHSKNSITRRKRSTDLEPVLEINVRPSLIDYTTSYNIQDREKIYMRDDKSANIIQNNDLANFNIQTLHEDSNLPTKNINENNNKDFLSDIINQKLNKNLEEIAKNISESMENESPESDENIDRKIIKPPYSEQSVIDRDNYSEKSINAQKGEDSIETPYEHIPYSSEQNQNHKDEEQSLVPDKHSEEIQDKQVENSSKESLTESYKPHQINVNSNEDLESSTQKSLKDAKFNDYENDNSQEELKKTVIENDYSDEVTQPTTNRSEVNTDSSNEQSAPHRISPDSLEGEDINKSIEHPVNINDREINPVLESNKEDEISDSSKERPTAEVNTDKSNEKSTLHRISPDSLEGDDRNDHIERLVNINDGEIKPVVELNNDDDISDSSEESSITPQNSHLESEEKYSSSEENHKSRKEANDKIVASKTRDIGNVNVKQQFERIPLDYNHDNNGGQKHKVENKDTKSSKANTEENINDGTLDALIPKVDKYDDNLNIKFDSVGIKLPEIYLPDDVLSYARVGAPNKRKNKQKPNTIYHFIDDDSSENSREQAKSIADLAKTHDYFDIYNNKDRDNYKRFSNLDDDDDNNEDDDEDLYEKFVRERFGKKKSDRRRSEKQQARNHNPSNPDLLETLRNIHKKTENLSNEAKNSGDPNAGYMWTLEYGENRN